jgi:hypothetical protein
MRPYVQSIAVRGIIFSKPVTKQPGFMMAFHKPALFEIEKRIRSKRLELGKKDWNGITEKSIKKELIYENENDPISEF